MAQFQVGERLVFTESLSGICTINAGNHAIYLGDDFVRVTDGPAAMWFCHIADDAPIQSEHLIDEHIASFAKEA